MKKVKKQKFFLFSGTTNKKKQLVTHHVSITCSSVVSLCKNKTNNKHKKTNYYLLPLPYFPCFNSSSRDLFTFFSILSAVEHIQPSGVRKPTFASPRSQVRVCKKLSSLLVSIALTKGKAELNIKISLGLIQDPYHQLKDSFQHNVRLITFNFCRRAKITLRNDA